MFVAVHRIGGITFRTRFNVPILSLGEQPFAGFRVGDDESPDVQNRVHRVTLDDRVLPALAGAERDRIIQGTHVEPGALDSPLLCAPAVRAWLRETLDRPTPVDIWLYQNQAIGMDFARREVDFFYTDEPGRDDADADEPFPVEDNNEPRRCFRMHQVTSNLQKAPPLPAGERERFARVVCFSSPEVLDHPLLRDPAIRARLHADLDQSKELLVSLRAGGLMVWTVGESTMDFYYSLGFDDPRLARVVGSYPRIFCAFLPDFAALPVHSAGAICDDRAALFLAPDEGGKTTVLRLAHDRPLLNDDQVIVRKEGDTFIAHATPFGRMTSGPCQAPVGGLFVLEKAPHFELTPLKPAPLVKSLWDEHRAYTSILPKSLKLRAFDLFYELCHRVPLYRMRFPKDYVDWTAIDAALA